MADHVRITKSDGILQLVLDRADKKNALTDAMYGALADAFAAAESDREVRVILIAGEGDMYTAGNDVSDFASAGASDGPRNVDRFLRAIAACSLPLVAAVQGRAVGVGTTMLLHCDYVLLAEGTILTTPFVNLALVPEAASSLLLPLRIGHARAFAAFALGEPIAAADAHAWGIANRVVEPAALRPAALEVASRLARQPRASVTATKALMKRALAVADQMDCEGREFAARLASPEAKEAFAAFAERRAPDFSKFD